MRRYNQWIAVASLLSITIVGYSAGPQYERDETSPKEFKDLQKGHESSDPQPLKHERPFTAENPPQRPRPEPQPITPDKLPPRQRPMPTPTPDTPGSSPGTPLQANPEQGIVR